MYQTWKNGKKLNFGLDFGQFDQNLGPKFFFHGFYLYQKLDIVASYHCMQFKRKLTDKTWKNGKKPSFRTDFGPLDPNIFFIDFTSTQC